MTSDEADIVTLLREVAAELGFVSSVISGRKNLGIGRCNLVVVEPRWRLPEHRAEVHIPAPNVDALERVFAEAELITLKIKLKYPDPMESVTYKGKCFISELTFRSAGSADLGLIFDGPISSTTG